MPQTSTKYAKPQPISGGGTVDLIDDLVTGGTDKALTAEQGKVLKQQIDTKVVPSLVDDLTTGGATSALSAEQGKVLKSQVDAAASAIPAVVNDLITGGTTAALSAEQGKVLALAVDAVADDIPAVVNDLTSGGTASALSAEQGKLLKQQVDGINVPAVVDNLTSGGTASALSAEQGKTLKTQLDSVAASVPSVIDNVTAGGSAAALSAEQGKFLKGLIDTKPSFATPQTLNGATALVAAHANRQIIYNGASGNLTIQTDNAGNFTNDEEFQIVTDDASSGIPTLVLPDSSAYPGGPNVIIGAVRKGANKWQAYTVSKTAPERSQVVTYQGNNVSIPGDTNTNVLVAQVIPGGTLGPNGWIECEIYVTRAAAGAGNLSFQMHLSSSQFGVATPMSPSHLTYRAIRSIFNLGAQNVQRCWPTGIAYPGEGGTTSAGGSSGVNTANDLTLYIRSVNAAVESTTMTLVKWRIRCFYGA